MKIENPAFQNNEKIPAKYTCDGINTNPPLKISGTPKDAKSLTLIMDDPDAPMGTWTHWIILNISPTISEIPENSVPPNSTELKTSFGKPGYGGPCPPSGTHRYFFKLYALDIEKINSVEEISSHTIAKAELVGLYSRK